MPMEFPKTVRRGVAPDCRQRRQIAPVYFKTSSRAYLVPMTSRYLLRSR